jgi:putative SOS response-associated peptidase YedK
MCNGFEQDIAYRAYCAAMEAIEWGMPTRQSELDLPPREHVHISEIAAVMRLAANGVELAPMRFGFPPPRPKASPIFNFRSEGRRFEDSRRCLIPVSAFFEYVGAKYPKTRYRFSSAREDFLCIAGIWRPANDNTVAGDFTLLTTAPGEDIKPYHNRQVVVLERADWPHWLYLSTPEAELLKPAQAGTLRVAKDAEGAEPTLLP